MGLQNGHPAGMPNKGKANLEQTCFNANNLGYDEHKMKNKLGKYDWEIRTQIKMHKMDYYVIWY